MRGWWFPENVSEHGAQVDILNFFIHNFMMVLFVGWGFFFVYCLVRFRRREGVPAQHELIHAKPAKYIEIAVIVVEIALLLVFSMPVWSTIKRNYEVVDKKQAVQVRVVGEQFAWNFHYPGPDGVFGKTSVLKMDAGNPLGIDRSDPYAVDDIYSRELRLPVNKDVVVYLTSKDVIHSFGVHVLRVKQDLIPGMEIPIWFKVNKTSEELRESGAVSYSVDEASRMPSYVAMQDVAGKDGTVIVKKGDSMTEENTAALKAAGVTEIRLGDRDPIEIACSQLCGLGHYRMKGIITVESAEAYTAWLASRAPQGSGAPAPTTPASTTPASTAPATEAPATGAPTTPESPAPTTPESGSNAAPSTAPATEGQPATAAPTGAPSASTTPTQP